MRTVAYLAVLAALGCEDPKTQTPEVTEVKTSAPHDGGQAAAMDAAPPPTLAAPAGTVRVAEVPGPAAFHFVTASRHVALIETTPITFASDGDDATDKLAKSLGLAKAKRGKLALFGPADQVAAAAKAKARPRGRKVDIDASGMSGATLADILGTIGRIKVDGRLGGTFSIRVKRILGNELLAVLAALCDATIKFTKGKATIRDSKCPATEARPAKEAPREPVFDELGLRVILPKATFRALRLAGVVSSGKKPRALLFAEGKLGAARDYVSVSEASIVGAEEDLCAGWSAPDISGVTKSQMEIARMEAVLKRLNDGDGDTDTIAETRALLAKAKADLAKVEAVQKRLRENPPPHPGCAGRGGVLVRWRLASITSAKVKFEATYGYPDGALLTRSLELAVAK